MVWNQGQGLTKLHVRETAPGAKSKVEGRVSVSLEWEKSGMGYVKG